MSELPVRGPERPLRPTLAAVVPTQERTPSSTLHQALLRLEKTLSTLPLDDLARVDTQSVMDEARTLLEQTKSGFDLKASGATAATALLDRAKQLRGMLEHFDQVIRLRQVQPTPAVEPRKHYDDEQGIRQRYGDLLQKKSDLEQQQTSWRNLFRRGELQRSLQMVVGDITKYQKKYPFVLIDHDYARPEVRQQESQYQQKRLQQNVGERQDALNKIMAVQKADISLELQRRELKQTKSTTNPEGYREDSTAKFAQLQRLLTMRPGRWESYDQWYRNCTAAEGYLTVYSKLGIQEQSQTAKYWQDKLQVLAEIKPTLFGRAAWQKQYDHATSERAYHLQLAKAASHRTHLRAAA
ncbi:MAG: hypothetical protein HY565_04540 [Candidatus Kerfeldbacteria bacterium]|nr:hypothetical protein [Candidatus Kerfeldbacteria bacterium]